MLFFTEFRAMGCRVTIQLEAPSEAKSVFDQIPQQIASIEAQLTRFKPDSDLMQLNAKAGEWVQVSQTLLENILAAKQAARITNGLYNPMVLPAIIASGYDRSFEQMRAVETQSAVQIPPWRKIEIKASTRQIRIPAGAALDLGGIGKGWTAQHIAEQLATGEHWPPKGSLRKIHPTSAAARKNWPAKELSRKTDVEMKDTGSRWNSIAKLVPGL